MAGCSPNVLMARLIWGGIPNHTAGQGDPLLESTLFIPLLLLLLLKIMTDGEKVSPMMASDR